MNWIFSLSTLIVILGTIAAWFALICGWSQASHLALLIAFSGYVLATIVLNRVRQ